MPPAPGKFASGEQATKPCATGPAIVTIRRRCSALGTCWVAAIQALDRARAIPPAPDASIRDADTSTPLPPTTATDPRSPSCSALSMARSIRARARSSGISGVLPAP